MRIHSDRLTVVAIHRALNQFGGEARALEITEHNSRSHSTAHEVILRGYGPRHTRPANSGTQGSDYGKAATYDDWGLFLAALYDVDPSIKAGPYRSRTHFHMTTNGTYNSSVR